MGKLSFCSLCGGIRQDCSCNHRRYESKKNTTERGYGWDWQKLSRRYRVENPMCQMCLEKGIITPAIEVHHRQKITTAPHLRLEWDNLMALCNPCHREIEE